ncbi:MAG: protein kinase, partial [Acidobacteriota bacterium]
MIGKTISHYRVLEKLGEGGMGEVYRAEDTNLGREVAIKVLPDLFAQDPQRLARFEREAKLLASLNHPNIAAIHSFEHADGLHFLVLELVEGETLAERVAKGPLPVEEALEICRQVAEGAEAAHEKGVIHRDLKPANVKITPEGQVKVLDFGLAKALEGETPAADISHSPTLTEEMTRSGVILGTAAYMSPEQARGKAVDKRADIWAFGCVLYEGLVGRQVFGGETVTDIIGAIVHKEPDWNVLPEKTPWNIRALLRRCLEKDPDLRLRDIWDVRIEIKQALSGAVEKLPDLAVARQPVWTLRRTLLLVSGMVLVTAVAGVIGWILKPAPELPLHKFELAVDSLEAGIETPLAVSPDGKKVVYVSAGRLWIRELDQLEPRQLSRSEEARLPFWSPDSAFVGYVAAGKLWRVPVSGGESTTISDLQGGLVGGAGATWGSNGQIVFSRGGTGLLEVSARGGDPQPLLELDPKSEGDFHQPHFLPDGRGVLFVVHRKQQAP